MNFKYNQAHCAIRQQKFAQVVVTHKAFLEITRSINTHNINSHRSASAAHYRCIDIKRADGDHRPQQLEFLKQCAAAFNRFSKQDIRIRPFDHNWPSSWIIAQQLASWPLWALRRAANFLELPDNITACVEFLVMRQCIVYQFGWALAAFAGHDGPRDDEMTDLAISVPGSHDLLIISHCQCDNGSDITEVVEISMFFESAWKVIDPFEVLNRRNATTVDLQAVLILKPTLDRDGDFLPLIIENSFWLVRLVQLANTTQMSCSLGVKAARINSEMKDWTPFLPWGFVISYLVQSMNEAQQWLDVLEWF